MKFTKEEISLCKQVAEKYRKEIEYGDWLLNEGGFAKVWPYRYNCKRIDVIPLWTISDCLEFLRERGFRYDLEDYHVSPNDLIYLIMSGGKRNVNRLTFDGKSPLEACLRAVLAVLEEEEK